MTNHKNKSKGITNNQQTNKQDKRKKIDRKQQSLSKKVISHKYAVNLKRFDRENTANTLSLNMEYRNSIEVSTQTNMSKVTGSSAIIVFQPGNGRIYPLMQMNPDAALGTTLTGLTLSPVPANIMPEVYSNKARCMAPELRISFTGSTFNNQGTVYVYCGPNPASIGTSGSTRTMNDVIGFIKASDHTTVRTLPQLRGTLCIHVHETNTTQAKCFSTINTRNNKIAYTDLVDQSKATDINTSSSYDNVWIVADGLDPSATFLIDANVHYEFLPKLEMVPFATPPNHSVTHLVTAGVHEAEDVIEKVVDVGLRLAAKI